MLSPPGLLVEGLAVIGGCHVLSPPGLLVEVLACSPFWLCAAFAASVVLSAIAPTVKPVVNTTASVNAGDSFNRFFRITYASIDMRSDARAEQSHLFRPLRG